MAARGEGTNHLALVSSRLIYFQKLTESYCRGFIYFYSEWRCALVQEIPDMVTQNPIDFNMLSGCSKVDSSEESWYG